MNNARKCKDIPLNQLEHNGGSGNRHEAAKKYSTPSFIQGVPKENHASIALNLKPFKIIMQVVCIGIHITVN